MFQQKVEELFFLQTGAFIVVGGDLGVLSNPTIVISLLPADAQLCLWNTAPALECFLPNFKHIMLSHPQSLARTGTW